MTQTVSNTISITRALAQVKALNDRITRATNTAFITTLTGGKHASGNANEDLSRQLSSNLQSVQALITQRAALKCAIIQSNAVSKVTINGKVMTVAEAIERKGSIQLEQVLLQQLRTQLAQATQAVERGNVQVNQRLDVMLQGIVTKDRKVDASEVAAISEPFLKGNQVSLLDPSDLQVQIEQLQASIDGFTLEVDYALSEVNATTKIELI